MAKKKNKSVSGEIQNILKPKLKPKRHVPKTRPPMSGYGAKPQSAKSGAASGAFSPERNRKGVDAYVTPKRPRSSQVHGEAPKTYRSISTSEHFEYGPSGDPAKKDAATLRRAGVSPDTTWAKESIKKDRAISRQLAAAARTRKATTIRRKAR